MCIRSSCALDIDAKLVSGSQLVGRGRKMGCRSAGITDSGGKKTMPCAKTLTV